MKLLKKQKNNKLYLVVDSKGQIVEKCRSWSQAHKEAWYREDDCKVMKQENLFN